MKGSCILVAASVLAASTVALSSSSAGDGDLVTCNSASNNSNNNYEGLNSSFGKNGAPNRNTFASSSDEEKFAPRFDGLRFIETLITAHR